LNSAPRNTRTTPSLMLRLRSGIALFRSMAMVRPKPRHSGQAPSGLLKLKRTGVGGRMSMSQWAQCEPVEKGISDCGLRIADCGEVRDWALGVRLSGSDRWAFSGIATTLTRSFP